jgi:iron complex outermembrane receptor protein
MRGKFCVIVESIHANRRIRAAVAAILAAAAFSAYAPSTIAQEKEEEELQEVQITGSRILRRDLESSSPIVTVTQEAFQEISTVAVEAALNRLPQFFPDRDQFDTADIQMSATNTVGATSVNLRNLGANRNLVLINGRRAVPVNATMAVDINSIPSAALSRVEIITGGASSVYGADAVGGVVNFILKDRFEGVDFDVQYGQTEVGDGSELRASGLVGGNFGNGRGNAMLGVEYAKRGDAMQLDRDFYRRQLADPYNQGTVFSIGFTQYVPDGTGFAVNRPFQPAVDALFSQAAPGTVANSATFGIQPDGTLFTAADAQGMYRYNGPLNLQYKLTDEGTLTENSTIQRLSSPLRRFSLFGAAHYDITDEITAYVQGTFSQSETEQVVDYVASFGTWGALIPYGNGRNCQTIGVTAGGCQDADPVTGFGAPYALRPTLPAYLPGGAAGLNCPAVGGCTNTQAFPVPAELAALLNARPDPNAPWAMNRSLDYLSTPRSTEGETTNVQLILGFRGELPVRDWTWDTYLSHGTSRSNNNLIGVASWTRYRGVVGSPNYGRGAVLQGNSGNPGNGSNAATARCTSGLPIFESFAVTEDCSDAISASLNNITKMDQTIVEGVVQGGLFDLPAGALRFAVGAGYRENVYSFAPDLLLSQGSFVDGAIGLDPIGGVEADDNVRELFVELLVPVLRDKPFATHLNVELGYRQSDYKFEGKVSTYKALLDWAFTPDLRLRGGYQRANRSPNLGELFQPVSDALDFGPGDPCNTNFANNYGANPNTNVNGAQAAAAVRALCEQLMGPTGANAFYSGPQFPQFGFSFDFTRTQGNPNLTSEAADTYTAGLVFRSPFEAPLARFTTSLDWYRLKVSDTIDRVDLFTLNEQCFSVDFNPTLDPQNKFCQQLPRNQTNGFSQRATLTFDNVGVFDVEGFDFSFNWAASVADVGLQSVPGLLSFGVAANYTLRDERQDIKGGPVRDDTGYALFNFPWQTFTSLGYSVGNFNTTLRWRHYPAMDNFAAQANPATLTQGVSSYNLYDLSASFALRQGLTLRAGVDNLLDKEPPINGFNPGTGGPGTTGYATGMLLTGSVYDVLGRRYYLGMKLTL